MTLLKRGWRVDLTVALLIVLVLMLSAAGMTTTGSTLGLAGWWSFDEDDEDIAYDSSGNGNDGIVYGAVPSTECISGKCLEFDGRDNYVEIPNSPTLDIDTGGFAKSITVMAWVYPHANGISAEHKVVMQKRGGGYSEWWLYVDEGKPSFSLWASDNPLIWGRAVSSVELEGNQWYLLTGTYDGTEIKIYVDSQLAGTYAYAHDLVIGGNPPIRIGTDGVAERWWDGRMDEVRIYNRALRSDEIGEYYFSTTGGRVIDRTPPYDASHDFEQRLNALDNALHFSNQDTGAVATFAHAWIGAASAEADQYIYIDINHRARVEVNAKLTYTGGTLTTAPAALAGISIVWRIDGLPDETKYLDSPWGWDDIVLKIIHTASLVAGAAVTSLPKALAVIGEIPSAATLTEAVLQMRDAGDAKTTFISFSFEAEPGRHTVGIGVRSTASAVLLGYGYATVMGQVDAIQVKITEQSYPDDVAADFESPITTAAGEKAPSTTGITDLELGGDYEWSSNPPGVRLLPQHLEYQVIGVVPTPVFAGKEGFISATFALDKKPATASLALKHGFFTDIDLLTPLQIVINGQVAEDMYWGKRNQIIEDQFNISDFLHQGENTLKLQVITPDRHPVTVDTNNPSYVIQRLEIETELTSSGGP